MYIAGLAGLRTGVRIVHRQHHDLALAVAQAERRVLQELRPRLLELQEVRLQLGVIVPAVEVEPHLELRIRSRGVGGFRSGERLLRSNRHRRTDERGRDCNTDRNFRETSHANLVT